jgi:hypothetical protein
MALKLNGCFVLWCLIGISTAPIVVWWHTQQCRLIQNNYDEWKKSDWGSEGITHSGCFYLHKIVEWETGWLSWPQFLRLHALSVCGLWLVLQSVKLLEEGEGDASQWGQRDSWMEAVSSVLLPRMVTKVNNTVSHKSTWPEGRTLNVLITKKWEMCDIVYNLELVITQYIHLLKYHTIPHKCAQLSVNWKCIKYLKNKTVVEK